MEPVCILFQFIVDVSWSTWTGGVPISPCLSIFLGSLDPKMCQLYFCFLFLWSRIAISQSPLWIETSWNLSKAIQQCTSVALTLSLSRSDHLRPRSKRSRQGISSTSQPWPAGVADSLERDTRIKQRPSPRPQQDLVRKIPWTTGYILFTSYPDPHSCCSQSL